MLNWMYKQSTDSYYAEIPCELDVPVILELDLSHSYPGQKWQLAAKTKTDPEMNFKIRATVPADPENTDIDDVKNRAAHAMNMTMGRAAVILKKAMSEIANDSVQPMPDKLTMAKSLWTEYKAVEKTCGQDGRITIAKNWREFNAGCETKYIEAWFMHNFKLTQDEFERVKEDA